jgi:hypothetical protein
MLTIGPFPLGVGDPLPHLPYCSITQGERPKSDPASSLHRWAASRRSSRGSPPREGSTPLLFGGGFVASGGEPPFVPLQESAE